MKLVLILGLITLCTPFGISQQYFGPQVTCDHENCGIEPVFEDKFTSVPPPEGFEAGGERDVVISVTYNNFPSSAQIAFQYAVDIWASILTSDVPITIVANYSSLNGSVLGFAGANDFEQNFSGAPLPNTFYPAPLANKLAGTDLNPGTADISCTFNSNTNWYFGTDANPPGGRFDFVSVVLHELGHGLGTLGGSSVNSGGSGSFGFGGTPVIWDQFTELGNGTDLSTLSGVALGNALTSNDVFWDGSNGIDGLNGTRPRIYAPGTWNGGSSYSHLNEGSYGAGNPNSLMTPFIGSAEAIHDPGPALLGMFQDMGWEIFPECDIFGFTLENATGCDPANSTFDLTVNLLYENPPEVGFLNVNGTNYPITGSPQQFTFNDLPADGSSIDMNAFFTAEGGCTFSQPNFYQSPIACCTNLRFDDINPDLEQFTVTNYGSCSESFNAFRISSNGDNFQFLNNLTLINGDLDLNPNESVTLQWDNWNPDAAGSNLSLFIQGGNFTSSSDILDYARWGESETGGESVAVGAGIWESGDFIADSAPFVFNGTPIEYGVQFWSGQAAPCNITSLSLGNSTGCAFTSQTFSQEVIIEFNNNTSAGELNVNGQVFVISASPMTVLLENLPADGNMQDVTAFFTQETSCSLTVPNLISAPNPCPCLVDINGDGIVAVDDLTELLAEFGCNQNCNADITGDDAVTSADITAFLSNFGTVCP